MSKLSKQQNRALFKLATLLFLVLAFININIVPFLSFPYLFIGGLITLSSFFIYLKNENKLFALFLKKIDEPNSNEYEQFVRSRVVVKRAWLKRTSKWFIFLSLVFIGVFMLDINYQNFSLFEVVNVVFFALCLSSIAFSFPYPAEMLDLDKKKI